MSNFFNKIPKDVTQDAEKVSKFIDGAENIDEIMKFYFGKYWSEFKSFWQKEMGETIDWINFALASHNAMYFIEYVFYKYPLVRDTVMIDFKNAQ